MRRARLPVYTRWNAQIKVGLLLIGFEKSKIPERSCSSSSCRVVCEFLDNMANQRRLVFAVTVFAGFVAAAYLSGFFSRSRPTINVLLITLDTTRADRLGCYGYQKAATPALDGLAAQGVLFERAYSPAPLTLPSHATMFTGLYPPEHGLRTNGRGRLDPSIPTLPKIAADAGYDTGAFVASFVVDSKFGLDPGFAVYDDDLSTVEAADEAIHRQRDGKLVVDAALAWLKQPREKKPFFCWVHLYDPHFPYLDHEAQFGTQFAGRPYDAEIAYTDLQIKRLLAQLDAAGLAEQTLVVVVGDHGEGLGDHVERTHGYTLYESTQHVPFLFRLPGKVAAGYRAAEPVPLTDLTPTLIDLLGLGKPAAMTGRSVTTALSGKPIEGRACFAATDDPFLQNGWSPLQCLVSGDWKYIRTTKPELYNLQLDPGETNNVAGQDKPQLAKMELLLDDLLRGLVPRQTASVQLSAEERRALESLGYLGGRRDGAAAATGDELPDVKDMLPFDVASQEAQDLLHAGKIKPAIERFRAIIAKSPAHLASRVFLGEALQHAGQLKEAIASYQEALKIKPDSANALVHLGAAYVTQGRINDAITQFDEAVRVEPESSAARYNLGLALAQLNRLDEAVEHYHAAIQHDEAFPDVHAALGNALITLGQSDEAIQQFQQEVKINPRAVEARMNLAVLLSKSDPQAAHGYLLEAVKLAPTNPQAQYNLGAFLLLQDKASEAITPLAEALRLMPDHPRAKNELEKARKMATEKK